MESLSARAQLYADRGLRHSAGCIWPARSVGSSLLLSCKLQHDAPQPVGSQNMQTLYGLMGPVVTTPRGNRSISWDFVVSGKLPIPKATGKSCYRRTFLVTKGTAI